MACQVEAHLGGLPCQHLAEPLTEADKVIFEFFLSWFTG